jgi:hypothetical protein
MLLVDYPSAFGGNVLQRPAEVDSIQAKLGEGSGSFSIYFFALSPRSAVASTVFAISKSAIATENASIE